MLDGLDRAAEQNGGLFFAAEVRHGLPHLARSESRIAKLVDQGGDALPATLGSAARNEGASHNEPEGEALDALSRPVCGQLLGADAPHLFCVRLEEDAEKAKAELVAHPVFEALRILHRLQPRARVARHASDSLDRTQVPQRVGRRDGIREEATAVVDAGQPAPSQHLVAKDLRPQVFDLLVLGEEPVAADVEPVALVLDGASQASYLLGVLLEDRDRDVVLEKLIGGSQPSGARAHDGNVPSTAPGAQSAHTAATSPLGSLLLA